MSEAGVDPIQPALSYAKSSDSLLALAPPEDMKSNRSKLRRLTHIHHLPRSVLVPLVCSAIIVNAICANGVYSYPSFGPIVVQRLRLSASEGQSIPVLGILGIYLLAAPVGSMCDKQGPRVASLIAALLNLIGYGTFALILHLAPIGTPNLHVYLGLCYLVVGAGTVCAYFASLTTASLSFPRHPTLALSLPLAAIGLSSLFISSIAQLPFLSSDILDEDAGFSKKTQELDPVKFLFVLAILIPLVNLFSAIFLVVLPPPTPSSNPSTSPVDEPSHDHLSSSISYADSPAHLLDPTERTPLLIGGADAVFAYAREEEEQAMADGGDADSIVHVTWTVRKFLGDRGFWAYGGIMFLVVGPAEMCMSSIGSIVSTLLSPESPLASLSAPSASDIRYKHVVLISICSTLARLATGVTADFLAPISSKKGEIKRILVHRSTFAAAVIALLIGTYTWGAFGLTTESGLWVISAGVGAGYGSFFTITPAITSRKYGPGSFGLAWGLVSYFGAAGSVCFSYLYAWVLESTAAKQTRASEFVTQCQGSACFDFTFAVSAAAAVVGMIGMLILGRKWRT